MQAIKGKSFYGLLKDYRRLRQEFWGRHLWARGDFVTSVGQVTEEAAKAYLEHQDVRPQDDTFKVTE